MVYAIAGLLLYYLQEKILFHPKPLAEDHLFQFSDSFREVSIPYTRESILHIVQFPVPDSISVNDDRDSAALKGRSKGVVLYFHGNRDNIERYAPDARHFTRNGYEAWMIEYPGFGKSTGKLTEQELYQQALVFYKLARARYAPGEIVIYGRSLGTGIASQLAAVRDCRALILEAPFFSLPSVVGYYAPVYPVNRIIRYKFPVHEHLKDVTAPILIMHGDKDKTIPLANSKRLKPILKTGDQFIIFEGASHNDLREYPLFHEKINGILSK